MFFLVLVRRYGDTPRNPKSGRNGQTVHMVMKLLLTCFQSGTNTGRAIGRLTGEKLASYVAELGGKVRNDFLFSADPRLHHHLGPYRGPR